MKKRSILMGRAHIPFWALGPQATESERLIAEMFLASPPHAGVAVIRFDLDDKEEYTRNVVTDRGN